MAIRFDGTNDALRTSTNILRHSGFSSSNYSFTVSCWVRPHTKEDSAVWSQKNTTSTASSGRLMLETTSGKKIRMRFQGGQDVSDSNIYNPTGDDDDKEWFHIVTTFTRTTRDMFIDGASAFSSLDTTTRNSLHENDDLDTVIGADIDGAGEKTHFDGDIAEWCAWKSVLNAGDISSLYAGASPMFIRAYDILSYYPLGGPLVTSSTGTTDAFRDVIGGNNLTAVGSPTFIETPAFYGTTNQSSSMFYPQTYIGGDSIPFSAFSAPAAPLREAYSESNLTGDDVIAEITQANLRKQGRISVNSGGINFKNINTEENELSPFIDRNKNFIVAENYISIMNNRLSKDDRQDQTDEIHGGGGDGNN
tara:strand:+ start:691 stop:1779 length:1089 start_codon:yes stop_codon:yes gene_type:complete